MHIHIPTTSDAVDSKGSKFKVFDIYVNGIYHGSVRYSQLLDLNNELKAKHDMSKLVEFPAKIFMINEAQLQQRKRCLERYIHCLAQDRIIGNDNIFQDFMLSCQQVSSRLNDSSVELEIFLCNGKSKKVTCTSYDRTPHVLEDVCKAIGISSDLTYYFGIFMEYASPSNQEWTTLNYLTDFQCPYLTLIAANTSIDYKFRLSIKRLFFSPKFLAPCLEDPTALNMIYIEGISDIESERLTLPDELKEKLTNLKKSGKRKEFVELLSFKSNFGFKVCRDVLLSDAKKTTVRVGGTELRHDDDQDKVYPISKLRCWKVGILRGSKEHFFSYEFEYARLKFVWIGLRGVSTILLAQSITQAVDEFVLFAEKKGIKKPSEVSYNRRPAHTLSQFELVSGTVQPPGEDLHMVVAGQEEPPSILRADSSSSKGSEASIETKDDEEETTPRHEATPISATPASKVSSTPKEVTPSRQQEGGETSHTSISKVVVKKPKKVKSSKIEEIAFNPTFVSDEDL